MTDTHQCEWPEGCTSTVTQYYTYGNLNVWLCVDHGLTIP